MLLIFYCFPINVVVLCISRYVSISLLSHSLMGCVPTQFINISIASKILTLTLGKNMSSRFVCMHEQQVLPLTFTNDLVERRETYSSFIIFSSWCQIVFTARHNFGPTVRYTIITLWSCRKVNTNL